jgi:hypothetical protein
MNYFSNPSILLTILFEGITAYEIDYEMLIDYENGQRLREVQKLIVFVVIMIMIVFDLYLQIKRVDYQILGIDNKIKDLVETFKK